MFGEVHDLSAELATTRHKGVLLLGDALYDNRRQLIPDAAWFRGVPHIGPVAAAPSTDIVPARVPDRLPDHPPRGRHFWLGPVHLHFGHFLVSTLSRLWPVPALDPAEFTFVYTGAAPPEALLAIPFVRDTFGALGLTAERLLRVAGPLFIPEITVAEPSLIENYAASPAFTDLLDRIGTILAPQTEPTAGPVYVSKERVTSGVRGYANENEVTTILAREGVSVACPDTLPFPEQVAFWRRHSAFMGFAGSAFHMAGFTRGRALCTVSNDHVASANQVMIDRQAGHRHLYLHAGPGLASRGPDPSFTDVVFIEDPARYARSVLDILDRIGNLPGQQVAPEPRSAAVRTVGYEPFGTNLARHGTATQSSVYETDEGCTRTPDGAISGRLTGFYQCSTQREDRPWWQLALRRPSRIYEVRIFNRAENPVVQARLDGFTLSLSIDGTHWTEACTHAGPSPGGMATGPFRWHPAATATARLVRIALPGNNWLHLDQVEVFGEELADAEA